MAKICLPHDIKSDSDSCIRRSATLTGPVVPGFFMGKRMAARTVSVPHMTPAQILNTIERWIIRAVTIALVLMFAVAVAGAYGFNVPFIPTMTFERFVWAAGGWALLTGRFKLG